MKDYIEKMQNMLNEEDTFFLKKIYEPTVVSKAPSNAFHSLCIMNDGEIRCYGEIDNPSPHDSGTRVYISSRDCGLSWKMHLQMPNTLGVAVKSPYSDRWLAPEDQNGEMDAIRISEGGPDSTDFKCVYLDKKFGAYHLPIALRNKKRWIFATDYSRHSIVFISDDDGDSWKSVEIEETDHFELAPPHKGMRWENSGMEPSVTELTDGTLMMILRTSTDYHYVTYSKDFGNSWSKPVPTTFHSTLTNPELLRLKDGRTVFFYNNTRPLPETEKESYWPPLSRDEITGYWEDVFTNRDSNCVAFSEDDGKSWRGFRELYLNELRNTCDFRSSGSNASGCDKSVHQFQAIELPYNKIMVHVGQHDKIRKIMIFDMDWLYETKRSENFRFGMDNISTQVYLKSVSGGYRGFAGHCAWNRTNGAVMVPDPEGNHTEVLLIKNTADDRLLSNVQGMVWNFPAATKGKINITLDILGEGIRISLADHWINPADLTVNQYAQFSKVITRNDLSGEGKREITVEYNTKTSSALFKEGDRIICTVDMQNSAPNGLCYLHLQTPSENGDVKGTQIKKFSFSKT